MSEEKPPKKQDLIEKGFEDLLWASRFCVIPAVIFGIISSLALFIIGSFVIIDGIREILPLNENIHHHPHFVASIISAIDLYLIGVVLLIFSFGIYELFISKIDIGRSDKELNILEITSLDQLKNRILKVVMMVLVVAFFKSVLDMKFTTPVEIFWLAISIFALCLGVYFLNKHDHSS